MHEKNCSVDHIILGGLGPLWVVMSNIVQKLTLCPTIGPNQLNNSRKWYSLTYTQFWTLKNCISVSGTDLVTQLMQKKTST